MKKILFIFTIILLVSIFSQKSYALKVLPQSKTANKQVSFKPSSAAVSITPKLRRDRKAIIVYFGNLKNAESISYMLVYKTNGQEEGAGGSVNPSLGNSASRELLFGTCSKNVCRYHPNISNMKLEVTTKLKSGKTTIKRFKIRV